MARHATFLLLAYFLAPPAFAQPALPDLSRALLLPPEALQSTDAAPSPSPSAQRRVRLFRIQPGFLSDVPWLDLDDRSSPEPRPQDSDSGPDWINVSAGNDNPYFEPRQRGDPGGLGFARVNTQLQLLETQRTSFALGLQAVTPLGLQSEGLADNQGPTVFSPALSLFHTLDEGLALQAYVGKHMPVMNGATRPVSRNLQYGLALQRAISTEESDPLSSVFLSVGALGQGDRSGASRLNILEVLPGLHWKPAETWWMSAAYVLPVGQTRPDAAGVFQLTCSWQY